MNIRNKKKLLFFIAVFLISVVTLFIYRNCEHKNNDNKPYFMQFISYVSSPIKSEYTFSFIYFVERNTLWTEEIENIDLVNIETAKVINYDVKYGDEAKKYNIFTLSLTLGFQKEGIEKLENICITYKSGRKETYSVGEWVFDIQSNEFKGNHLRIGSKYALSTKSIKEYWLSIENISDKKVHVSKLFFSIPNIKYNFDEFSINSKDTIQKRYEFEKESFEVDNTYYFIKPRIEYICEDNKFTFYPFGVYYGLLDVTDNTIENEIQKAKRYQNED